MKLALPLLALALAAVPLAGWAAPHANPQRTDPYKSFKFRIKWDGQVVGAFSSLTAAPAAPAADAVVEHRSGGDPSTAHKSPGRNKYEIITLERGLTQDLRFASWAQSVESSAAAPTAGRAVTVQLADETGRAHDVWRLAGCHATRYRGPQLAAQGAATSIEELVLACERVDHG